MEDLLNLRKLCIVMAINLKTGLDFFLGLSIFDLLDLCEDYNEISKEVNKGKR